MDAATWSPSCSDENDWLAELLRIFGFVCVVLKLVITLAWKFPLVNILSTYIVVIFTCRIYNMTVCILTIVFCTSTYVVVVITFSNPPGCSLLPLRALSSPDKGTYSWKIRQGLA